MTIRDVCAPMGADGVDWLRSTAPPMAELWQEPTGLEVDPSGSGYNDPTRRLLDGLLTTMYWHCWERGEIEFSLLPVLLQDWYRAGNALERLLSSAAL